MGESPATRQNAGSGLTPNEAGAIRYHIEGRSELEGKETVNVTTISEVAYQKEQEAIIKAKAEQADVDAIAAAIERGLSL